MWCVMCCIMWYVLYTYALMRVTPTTTWYFARGCDDDVVYWRNYVVALGTRKCVSSNRFRWFVHILIWKHARIALWWTYNTIESSENTNHTVVWTLCWLYICYGFDKFIYYNISRLDYTRILVKYIETGRCINKTVFMLSRDEWNTYSSLMVAGRCSTCSIVCDAVGMVGDRDIGFTL